MLQVPNILRRPQIWLPPIIASAIVGPISTIVFQMTNTPTGAGMGTSGLVGQFGAWAAMSSTTPAPMLIFEIILVHFVLPAVITLIFAPFYAEPGGFVHQDLKLEMMK